MKNIILKACTVIEKIYAVMAVILLFAGGLCFFGYAAAIIIGGSTAEMISVFIYTKIMKVLIYGASAATIIGLLYIYLKKQKFLTFSDGDK